MSILEQLVEGIQLPRMVKVRQSFERRIIENISLEVSEQLKACEIQGRIKKGARVAITAGSRGISNLPLILKEIANELKVMGAHPFIVPAMGSHGGATAEGQIKVLRNLGITEESIGVPIKSTMETVQIGTTESGLAVYFDRYAAEADATIVVGRIKPHTSFRGPYESGLAKMIVIGLGKQKGAEICHATGLSAMSKRIEDIARLALKESNIVFGVGIIENAYDETSNIVAIPREKIMDEEPPLLVIAKNNLAKILIDKCDVLIVDEIGKDISGTGMDANIIRRFSSDTIVCEPLAQKIIIFDLTDATHGNANGMGLADITTRRMYEKIDFYETYPNPLTSRIVLSVKIPMVMDTDSQAIRAAMKTCFDVSYDNIRIIRIKNTLKLDEMYISENLLDEVNKNPRIEVLEQPKDIIFDEKGNLF